MFVLGIVLLIGVIYVCFLQIHKKKAGNSFPDSAPVETRLARFTYQELFEATDGFKVELGKGAFGTVYKGVIGTESVAVKKLETMVKEGQKEFKTEVNTIARTHHKNLVQLLGYCDDGERRLLIFEYMSNGTLAFFLFGDSVVFDNDAEDVTVLTDLAWDCYHEGRLDAFVKNDLEALDDFKKLTRYMMVGLWCVQENPSLRPTMKKVIQMLEGVGEVTEPPCPCPFSVTSYCSSSN
ncbi:hypothetical protein L1987_00594 [Smallanthus sonchifolius]|uniref:Uncharacterized protein n=1 Tax=Smallanthus sonchifolius TaxID=185202 RepID=A0ACB9K2K0_9ASTR|nr:hypothetical protein L1987_00594 [Smallanthus sonchifolius]